MNEEIKTANAQSSLAGGGISEEEKQWQIKKARMKKRYRLMSIALIAIIIVAGGFFAKSIWTGWISFSGNRYYYVKGEKVVGLTSIENKQYFFDDSGAMQTGWQSADGVTYFFGADGVMQTGWLELSGKSYYLAANGAMQTGWLKLSEKSYYFGANGTMQTGWLKIGADCYYFDTNGVMLIGWQSIEGNTYYLNDDGIMQTGFQVINGKKYYLGDDGKCHIGWLNYNGGTYFCSAINYGALAEGKWSIEGEYYHFGKDGMMSTGAVEINSGDTYYFDENGHFLYRTTTQKNVPTTKSEEQLTFKNKSGGNSKSHSRELNTPVENCLSLTIVVSTTAVNYGSGDGERQVYIHTLDGKWESIGLFNVSNDVGEFSITFDEPTSFDAFICPRYEGKSWSGTISQELKEVTYCSYDFGTNVKFE